MQERSGDEWLRRPEIGLPDLSALGFVWPDLTREEAESLNIQVKYGGYIARAERQLASEGRAQQFSLETLDYSKVGSLSNEAREKLGRLRPQTLAQAARVPGVRHADISSLLIHVRQQGRAQSVSRET